MNALDTLPSASLVHHMDGRIRIRITGPKSGRKRYFSELSGHLKSVLGYRTVRVNASSGSVVLEDPDVDVSVVAAVGSEQGLFMLKAPPAPSPLAVAETAKRQVRLIDSGIQKLSANRLDMSGSVFILLIVHAIREIFRGNAAMPSWFTALWFASTLYNRDFLNPGGGFDGSHAHGGGDSHDGGDADAA